MYNFRRIETDELFRITDSIKETTFFKGYFLSDGYYKFNLEYYNNVQNASIVCEVNGAPIFVIPLFEINGLLSLYGMPTQFLIINHRAFSEISIRKPFMTYLKKNLHGKTLFISPPSSFLHNFLNEESRISQIAEGRIDLSMSMELIISNTRKSYRSLINWGRRNLDLKYVTSQNFDQKLFKDFEQLHLSVAGVKTRSCESWGEQLEMIRQDKSFLILGYYQGALVTGVLVIEALGQAFYGTGVAIRSLMEDERLPLSHYPLIRSIELAKERGNLVYSLGQFSFTEKEQKIASINKFKQGFITHLEAQIAVETTF